MSDSEEPVGNPERRSRVLTDADIAAIATELEKRLTDNFYKDLGKGVWGLVKKALLAVLVGIAAYGAINGVPKP